MTNTETVNRPLNINATAAEPYSVNLWGSHPDAGNDDCWTGANFATKDEALGLYRALAGSIGNFELASKLDEATGHDWEFAEIDGPDIYDVSINPDQPRQRKHRRERDNSDAQWKHENAMQAGMAFGCDGYNDAMGW
jgi:hypothetical protein